MKNLIPVCTRKNLVVGLVLAISMVGISYGAGGVLPGDGLSESTAYLIEDLADFNVFADPCNSATYWASGVYTKLTCDPNLTGRTYTTAVIAPDGSSCFEGIFDGASHIISNLTINTAGANNHYLGLFGKIEGSGAEVKNIGMENINITGGTDSGRLGSLCGSNGDSFIPGGTITNCYSGGSVTGGGSLGGLCGYNDGTIANCYATGVVTGGSTLGGLCGYNHWNSTIRNCYATGSVAGGNESCDLGGLCGVNWDGIITNCYATGSVTGGDNSHSIGGLCGFHWGQITNCYAIGLVTGDDHLGGLVGNTPFGMDDNITNCYFLDTNGPDNGYGEPLTDSQMKQQNSFTGWDFTGETANGTSYLWIINAGEYPLLFYFDQTFLPYEFVGQGTAQEPYLIYNADDLGAIWQQTNRYYRLDNNIDLTGINWSVAVVPVFSGVFDGNDHIISDLNISVGSYLGLFGVLSSSSTVMGLGVENVNIAGGYNDYIGGLCGLNYGTISNCYTTGSVTGNDDLGGLCGYNDEGSITNCYSGVSVTGIDDSECVGGLFGGNNYGTISNCYATGSVTGGDGEDAGSPGGLCGYNSGGITNCYATGSVTGEAPYSPPGGLCGYNSGTITNCFWDVETSGMSVSDGGTGKTTAQMQTESTFTDAGWDFVDETANGTDDIWIMACYPVLTWQVLEYVNVPDIVNITQAEAEAAITGLGLFVGTVTFSYHDTIPAGVVISQDPQAGISVPMGSFISFVVSLGIFDSITGSGTESDPYVLDSFADFQEFTNPDNAETYWASGVYTRLDCDLDLDPALTGRQTYTTAVIAPDTSTSPGFQGTVFAGIFDGNDHTICNLTNAGNDYLGLFGRIGGEIKNLGIENINITGGDYLGGLCGSNLWDSTITNCYATGSVTGGYAPSYLGGLCGSNYGGIITNCYATGSVTGGTGSFSLGGLCGKNGYGTITHCYATSSVTGGNDSRYLGGLCGYDYNGTITNCYTTGLVTSGNNSYNLGGLCGENEYSIITNCYATGAVTGGDGAHRLGGLCGENEYSTITNCYSGGSVTGGGGLGGLCGDNDGTITNCYATGSITGGSSLGGLCGSNGGTIIDCYATGLVTGDDYLGGLCGSNNGSNTITNCYSTGSVTGDDYLGGLCGSNNGTITNCYTTGLVTGDNHLGGLCGKNGYGTITNCYAAGSITGGTGSYFLGGLCGYNYYGTITNCYATGSVTGGDGSDNIGGLCGRNYYYGWITNCFWDVETGGPDNGLGTPKTTEEMQTESTFTDAGWDFSVVPVWHMPFEAIGYPMLAWQRDIPGDFTGSYGVDMVDFAVLSDAWLSVNTPTANWNEDCDLNGSGVIDTGDLKIFAEYWLCD